MHNDTDAKAHGREANTPVLTRRAALDCLSAWVGRRHPLVLAFAQGTGVTW